MYLLQVQKTSGVWRHGYSQEDFAIDRMREIINRHDVISACLFNLSVTIEKIESISIDWKRRD